jgi:RNA polymerase sigma factor (sigma-70 family)
VLLRVLLEHDPVTENRIGRFDHFFTSARTLVEVPRALARDGRLSTTQWDEAQQRFSSFLLACDIAEIDRAVRDRAALGFPSEPVRTLDAIHLATLVVFGDLFESLVVASTDDRVRGNARAGIRRRPVDLTARRELVDHIASALESLPERLRIVLALHYQEECSFREIGEVLGVTESRICQLHAEAIHRVRAQMTSLPPPAPKPRAVKG